VNAAATGGFTLGLFNFVKDRLRKSIAATDDLETRASFAKPLRFEAKEGAKQPENALHFGSWTLPVVRRKGVQGQPAHCPIEGALDNATHCRHSGTMAGDAG
jgi:hypothetical protein